MANKCVQMSIDPFIELIFGALGGGLIARPDLRTVSFLIINTSTLDERRIMRSLFVFN